MAVEASSGALHQVVPVVRLSAIFIEVIDPPSAKNPKCLELVRYATKPKTPSLEVWNRFEYGLMGDERLH